MSDEMSEKLVVLCDSDVNKSRQPQNMKYTPMIHLYVRICPLHALTLSVLY